MGGIALDLLLRTIVGVAALTGVATAVLLVTRAPHPFAPAAAILRGMLQLAVISLILSGVIRDPVWVGVALAVMFTVAVSVAHRRLGGGRRALRVVLPAMGTGVAVAVLVVFASGALTPSARYALAIGGIVIGNTMSIATIGGRRFLEATADRWEEVEGWLALGAPPRIATRDIARTAVHAALIPSTDQTKTTGLVTLPGAFVGAIFGGLSPLEAGRFQIVVLAAIMCAGALTAAVLISLMRDVRTRPIALR